jgi:uncharacterized protein with PIN domain
MAFDPAAAAQFVRPEHFPRCEQCGSVLRSPEWSEFVSERCQRHLWACTDCGYAFETSVYYADKAA